MHECDAEVWEKVQALDEAETYHVLRKLTFAEQMAVRRRNAERRLALIASGRLKERPELANQVFRRYALALSELPGEEATCLDPLRGLWTNEGVSLFWRIRAQYAMHAHIMTAITKRRSTALLAAHCALLDELLAMPELPLPDALIIAEFEFLRTAWHGFTWRPTWRLSSFERAVRIFGRKRRRLCAAFNGCGLRARGREKVIDGAFLKRFAEEIAIDEEVFLTSVRAQAMSA